MHRNLLGQATILATLDARGKPKQVNLRRAVSAAYYGLFHFLVGEACRAIIGAKREDRGYRDALARAFAHGTMKNACTSFERGVFPDAVSKPLGKLRSGGISVPTPVRDICTTFKELQQKRHLADYDPSEQFRRSEVLSLIQQTERQIQNFQAAGTSAERHFFLVCLLTWKELSNR